MIQKKKCLLIFPPQLYGKHIRYIPYEPPLGLAYIAAILEQQDHQVAILDCLALHYSLQQISDFLKKEKPGIIGISSLTASRFDAFSVAKTAKETIPSSTIILGGAHVWLAAEAEQTLNHVPYIDVVVRGEGEATMVDLVNTIQRGGDLLKVYGISYRNEEGAVVNNLPRKLIENLDQLPFPARHLLDLHRYRYHHSYLPDYSGDKIASLMASRGCPYNCVFCNTPKTWGRKIRYRSPQNVVDEIELCISKFGYRGFRFHDDAFTVNRRWVFKFCDELIDRGINLPWSCCGRANVADRELFQKMKSANCYSIAFGGESGSQRILDLMDKRITVDEIKDAFKTAQEAGLLTFGYFMIGSLGEEEADVKKTLDLVSRLRLPAFGPSITVLYPSTTLYDLATKNGKIQPNFSWTQEIPEIHPKLIGLPFFIDPFCPTFQPEDNIIGYYEKHKKYIHRLILNAKRNRIEHDYGRFFLFNPRFWYYSYKKYGLISRDHKGVKRFLSFLKGLLLLAKTHAKLGTNS